MAAKKVKVKVTKKRVNVKRIIIGLLVIIAILLVVAYIINRPIKNIYITGNNIVPDKEIIRLSGLEDYPSYVNTYFMDIAKDVTKNKYIKNVTIKRSDFSKIYLNVEEYQPICIYNDELILSSKEKVVNEYDIDYVPYVINNIDSIYDKFVTKFSLVTPSTLLKISHIEYVPNEVDNERFLLYMVDSNYVYVTLSKIEKINKYNSIVGKLENKKGIIYLDSGDYVEIKGWHK